MAKRADRFTVRIALGNAAMLTGSQIARALRKVADEIEDVRNPRPDHSRSIRDVNGNMVGEYEIEDEV